jgi:hypothetical protein
MTILPQLRQDVVDAASRHPDNGRGHQVGSTDARRSSSGSPRWLRWRSTSGALALGASLALVAGVVAVIVLNTHSTFQERADADDNTARRV